MRTQVIRRKGDLAALGRRYDVRRLELFGSAATDEFKAGASDLDFLVEFVGEGTEGFADRYFGLLEGLEEMFGCPVDLVVASAVKNPFFRDAVDRTKVLVYAG